MNRIFVTGGVASLLAIAAPGGVGAPELKEGLWSVHTQTIEKPANKKTEAAFTMCRDHAYDRTVREMAKAMQGCTVSETFQPGKYFSETLCKTGSAVIVSKGITAFQSDTSIHSESQSSYAPAVSGVSESTTIMDQKYVGSCPANMQPGDRTMPNGSIFHLKKP